MMKATRKIYLTVSWTLVLAVMIFIFLMSSASGNESAKLSGSFLRKITELTGLPITSYFIRKAAHFSEFALLSFSLSNALFATLKKKNACVIAFALSAIYAVTDELHQLFSDGRACQVKDMLIDSSGALFGALIYFVIILIYIKHIERKKDNGSIKTV